MNRNVLLLRCVLALVPLAAIHLSGAEETSPKECVSLSRIDRTEIIDDRHIAFFMKNRNIYVNALDRACPTLRPGSVFSYRTSVSQLCDTDVITVLENTGFGLRPGVTCGLGSFTPTDEETLAMLKGEVEPATVIGREVKPDELPE